MMEWVPEQFEKLDSSKIKIFKRSSNIGQLKKAALQKWMNCKKMCKCNVTSSWNDMANCLMCGTTDNDKSNYVGVWSGSCKPSNYFSRRYPSQY